MKLYLNKYSIFHYAIYCIEKLFIHIWKIEKIIQWKMF